MSILVLDFLTEIVDFLIILINEIPRCYRFQFIWDPWTIEYMNCQTIDELTRVICSPKNYLRTFCFLPLR